MSCWVKIFTSTTTHTNFYLLSKLVFINFLTAQFVHICNLLSVMLYFFFSVLEENITSFLALEKLLGFPNAEFCLLEFKCLEFKWTIFNQVRGHYSTFYRGQISNKCRGLFAGFWSIFSSTHYFFFGGDIDSLFDPFSLVHGHFHFAGVKLYWLPSTFIWKSFELILGHV